MEALDTWIERQYHRSAAGMLRSVSALHVKVRPGFDQIIRPQKGSIVASPVLAAYDPEPDYFFHWYRDSAIVADALRLLSEDPDAGVETRSHFADFVHFSASLQNLDGRALVAAPHWRSRVADDYRQFLRTDADLAGVHGAAASAETRVNPDGSVDISRWPRPQYDGPALRALTLIRWLAGHAFEAGLTACIESLLRSDLALTRRYARQSCFDIWEEEKGLHYYTLRVAAAALRCGARWLDGRGEADGRLCGAEADAILRLLDGYWLPEQAYLRSRVLDGGAASSKDLDFAVILAAIHVGDSDDPHTVDDVRVRATMSRLEDLFDTAYAINRSRPPERAPAMGRYAGDVYFSGGAYYFSTLGAAEFYFRAARSSAAPRALIERGDAFLRTVQAFTPQNGGLAEQFDQHTGAPRSARDLAWSYAAFISCIAARRLAARSDRGAG